MKAKDTKLKGDELVPYIFTKNGYRTPWSIAEKVAKAQAEISFKAGIKEVVDWVYDDLDWSTPFREQLKVWGIKR